MNGEYRPQSAADAAEIIAAALGAETPLEVGGAGTKCGIGRPIEAEFRITSAELSGLTLYEPEELVLGVRPGTPMAQLQLHLDQHRQMLAFEPPDFGALLGSGGGQTIGGVVAGNLSGPRRIKAGAARDHFLGFEAVSGRGEAFRSGGRVVKNVTGYDLCKLMCGSWGTLGLLTELTLKVMPAPEHTSTVLLACPDPRVAVRAMAVALGGPNEVSAAAWISDDAAMSCPLSAIAAPGRALAALRLEGFEASVRARCAALHAALSSFGDTAELDSGDSLTLWRFVGDAAAFADDMESAIWRVSVPPSAGAEFFVGARDMLGARGWLDWGGGLVWLAVADSEDAGAVFLRAAAGESGGHAMLLRGSEEQRARFGTFQPEPVALTRLTRRIKEAFDPGGILNAGRMYEGI